MEIGHARRGDAWMAVVLLRIREARVRVKVFSSSVQIPIDRARPSALGAQCELRLAILSANTASSSPSVP